MAFSLTTRRVRLQSDYVEDGAIIDRKSGKRIAIPRASDVRFEIGIFAGLRGNAPKNAGQVASETGWESLTLTMQSSPGVNVVSKTVSSFSSLTYGTWNDDSAQHCIVDLTDAETNIPAGRYRLALTIQSTTFGPFPAGTAEIDVFDPFNLNSSDAPDTNPGAPISRDAADARYAPLGSAGSSTSGNSLFVDVDGSDATGTRERFDKPFLTLEAALAAASSGDCIFVRPGHYSPATQLFKNGVNWFFEPGTWVDGQTSGTGYLFDDSVDGANEAVKCTIGGHGVFADVTYSPAIRVSNASSRVVMFTGDSLVIPGVTLNNPTIEQTGGYLKIVQDGNLSNALVAVNWTNGELHCDVEDLQTFNAVAASSSNTQHVYLTCKTIGSMNIDGASSASRFWIRCADTSNAAIVFDNARVYLQTLKSGYGMQLKQTGSVAEYWIDSQKITGASLDLPNRGPALQLYGGISIVRIGHIDRGYSGIGTLESISCSGGTHRVVVDTFDTNATGTSCIVVSGGTLSMDVNQVRDIGGGTAAILNQSGGTLSLKMNFTAVTTTGINLSGGTLDIASGKISTAAINTTNPITFTGSATLKLGAGVRLIAQGSRDSIERTSGTATVLSFGAWANNAPDAAVIPNPPLYVDSNVS